MENRMKERGDYEEEREPESGEVTEEWRMAMGFPSPADIYRQGRLDLNRLIVKRPAATFFVRVEGQTLIEEGIEEGEILVIDRAESILTGQLALVRVGGEMLVRRVEIGDGRVRLHCAGTESVDLDDEPDWEIWGRVTFSIRQH